MLSKLTPRTFTSVIITTVCLVIGWGTDKLHAQPAGPVAIQESPPISALTQAPEQSTGSPSDLNLDPSLGNQDSLTPLQNRDLSTDVKAVNISLSGLGTGLVPESPIESSKEPVGLPNGMARGAMFQCVHWRPATICHFPLYFEDAMLERHGQVRYGRLQSFASGAKFFTTIALLPYLKTLQPSCTSRYALGHYRPGSCAPVLKDHVPYDRHAVAVESLTLAGFFWGAPL